MYLRDIAIYGDERIAERFPSGFVGWFHRETCCITELYSSLLGKRITTPDTAKVNLCFIEQQGFAPTVRQRISVADAKCRFDYFEYAKLDVKGKKKLILDSLQAALLWIAKNRKWATGGFEECYAEVVRRDLEFEGWSKKIWLSPNPKYRVKLGFYFGLRLVEFYVGVFDKKGHEIGRTPLGSVAPEMGIAHLVLKGQGRWLAGSLFRLQIMDDHFYSPKSWEVDLSNWLV